MSDHQTTDVRIVASSHPPAETIAAAVAILHDSFAPDEGDGVSAESFMTPQPGRSLVVAEHDGDVVGFARVDQIQTIHGLLAWLAVADGSRSMGLGRRLIDASAGRLADAGATSMFVECRIDDYYAPRRRFYERNRQRSISGGDYWLRSHVGTAIQYDLLHRPLADDVPVEHIIEGATLIHRSGTGIRPDRLDAGLTWTLRDRLP
jgi:predicted N-acetyltransferase YhbS